MEANIQQLTKNIPQGSCRAQVSLLVGRSWRREARRSGWSTADPRLGTGAGDFYAEKPQGDARGTRGAAPRSDGYFQGLSSLTALVVSGVRTRRREACEAVSKLLETSLQFRFRNFRDLWVYRIGWDSGKGRAPGAGRGDTRSLQWSSQDSRPPPLSPRARAGDPCAGSLDPARGRLGRSGAPGSAERGPRAGFVRSSSAAAAHPSPLVGNRLRRGQTRRNPNPSPLPSTSLTVPHPCTAAEGPVGPIGVSAPSKWTQVPPGRRKSENRLQFGTISWRGGWGVGRETQRGGWGEASVVKRNCWLDSPLR